MKLARAVMEMVERYGVVKVTWKMEEGSLREVLDSCGLRITH